MTALCSGADLPQTSSSRFWSPYIKAMATLAELPTRPWEALGSARLWRGRRAPTPSRRPSLRAPRFPSSPTYLPPPGREPRACPAAANKGTAKRTLAGSVLQRQAGSAAARAHGRARGSRVTSALAPTAAGRPPSAPTSGAARWHFPFSARHERQGLPTHAPPSPQEIHFRGSQTPAERLLGPLRAARLPRRAFFFFFCVVACFPPPLPSLLPLGLSRRPAAPRPREAAAHPAKMAAAAAAAPALRAALGAAAVGGAASSCGAAPRSGAQLWLLTLGSAHPVTTTFATCRAPSRRRLCARLALSSGRLPTRRHRRAPPQPHL